MKRALAPLIALFALGALVVWFGRHKLVHLARKVIDRSGIAAAAASHAPLGPPGTLDVHARPAGKHPRILLTPERMAKVVAQKEASTPQWKWLLAECTKLRDGHGESGYEAWDWANATLNLALCAKATGDADYGAAAVRYFTALLDDKYKVGDGAGGDAIVHHDLGYSIRAHGALGAIAYDWLHDAPGMTPALRKRALDRLLAWTAWFKANGYHHDEPISNYYAGYFGAVAFGGIATEGDDPRADALRVETQRMWNQEIVPAYRAKLAGGDFPEGWQYGDLVGVVFGVYADAENTSHPVTPGAPPPRSLYDELPWLREAVTLRAFALLPDGKHTYDNGDWSHKPALAPSHLLYALAIGLPSSDPAARQAAYLVRLARQDGPHDQGDEWRWLQILGDEPTRPVEDPRRGTPSYLSPGTATAFARSSFSPGSLWFSLTSPRWLANHQHLDSGHFEVVRGADPVLIDGGGYSAWSSLSHNVVAVDDPLQSPDFETSKEHGDVIRYKRNQAPFSDTAQIARFEDGGGYVYALADYASAFNPKGWPERRDRAVSRAEREAIFSRAPVSGVGTDGASALRAPRSTPGESGRVVIYDRLTLSDTRFTTAFLLHGGLAPQITWPLARFTTGASSAWVTTLLPAGASPSVVNESNNEEVDPGYFNNFPPEGVTSFRYEVASPTSPASTERRFLHAIVIGAAGGSAPTPERIDGDQVDGAAIDGEAYLFARATPATQARPMAYRAPLTATRHIVVDLAPQAAYSALATPDRGGCKVTLTSGVDRAARSADAPSGAGKTASPKGVLVLDVTGCAVH